MSDLSTRVRLRREQLGLSQEELARRMGYRSRSSITKLEKGINDLPQSKVEELAQALETTPAALLGLDPARITVAGSDAGGLMALHVALPDHPARWSLFRKKAPLPPGPAAVALFRGVCDLTAQSAFKLGGMMPPDQRDAVNPLRRVQRGLPPLFASHGGRDRLLPWRNSERLAELWRKKKNRSRFELLDVADHTFYHFNVNAAYFEQLLNSWSAFMVEQGIWEYNEGMDTGLLG